jgi:hypothetical protein
MECSTLVLISVENSMIYIVYYDDDFPTKRHDISNPTPPLPSPPPTLRAVFGYEGNSNDVKVVETGGE